MIKRVVFLSAFGFIFVTLLEIFRRLMWPDLLATQFLQTVVSRQFDTPLSLFSLMGSGELSIVFLIIICSFVYLKKKNFFFPGMIFAGFVVFHLIEILGKNLIYHPGPPAFFFRYSIPFIFPSTAYVHSNYSYPSGHVGRTLFLATITSFLIGKYVHKKWRKRGIGLVIALYCLLMIVSRVYLGEHWFSDVIGGAFLGVFMGALAVLIW